MSAAADVMAGVMFAFFLVGVAVGVVVVIALSARRADKAARQSPPAEPPRRTWPYRPETDDHGPDEPPWWQARGGD